VLSGRQGRYSELPLWEIREISREQRGGPEGGVRGSKGGAQAYLSRSRERAHLRLGRRSPHGPRHLVFAPVRRLLNDEIGRPICSSPCSCSSSIAPRSSRGRRCRHAVRRRRRLPRLLLVPGLLRSLCALSRLLLLARVGNEGWQVNVRHVEQPLLHGLERRVRGAQGEPLAVDGLDGAHVAVGVGPADGDGRLRWCAGVGRRQLALVFRRRRFRPADLWS